MQVIAGAAVISMMLAVPAQIYGSAPQGTSAAAKTEDGKENSSFEEAVEAFYQNSGSITDEQILASARDIVSDTDAMESELKADERESAAKALFGFEEAKASYLTSVINKADTADAAAAPAVSNRDAVCREWDRQGEYAQMMITEGAVIREMIPRYQVVSCTKKDDTIKLDVDEWMTQGYSSSVQSQTVNASAYSYSFTLTLKGSGDGTWTPAEINGTDVNFLWLGEGEDYVTESQESPVSLYEVKSDMESVPVAYAQISDTGTEKEGAIKQDEDTALSFEIDESAAVPSAALQQAMDAEENEVYEASASGYTYHPSKAVAYADKYWKQYNRDYKEYRGVDCANFVSQCLYAGGMPKTSDWFPQSVNWINVMGHIRHFKEYGTFLTASNANVSVGNPVYYDWNGNGTYDHTALCVGKNSSGMPVVDGHTSNVYHVPWSMGSRGKRGTIVLRKSAGGGSSNASAQSAAKSRNVWRTVSGKVYYIGPDGKYVKNKFLTINGGRYYFNSSGARVTGFFKVGSKWYYASVKTGKLLQKWQWIGGKTYYFSVKDYSRMTPGKHKIGHSYYYFNSKGQVQHGFIKIGSKWYYADKKTGKFAKGWKKISGKWYYFDKKTLVRASGWKTINGRKCYFDSKGVLKKGKHG